MRWWPAKAVMWPIGAMNDLIRCSAKRKNLNKRGKRGEKREKERKMKFSSENPKFIARRVFIKEFDFNFRVI